MCFSPQPRAYFRHLNFKKWPRTPSFLTFSLPNVLFATAACNFWCILSAPTSAPAALTGLLFDWPDTRIYEKTQHFVTSLTFSADVVSFFLLSRYCMFFLLTSFCWLDYSTPLFNFPYCRKFLFKLPSMIIIIIIIIIYLIYHYYYHHYISLSSLSLYIIIIIITMIIMYNDVDDDSLMMTFHVVLRRYFLRSACRSHLIKSSAKQVSRNSTPPKKKLDFKNPQSSPLKIPNTKNKSPNHLKVQNHLPTKIIKIPTPKRVHPNKSQTIFVFFSIKGTAGRAARCAWGDPSEGTQQGWVGSRRVGISPIQSYDLGMGFFHHQSYSIGRGLDSWGYFLEIWWIYPSPIIMVQWKTTLNKRKLIFIGDAPIFHWTMIMGGRASWWWMLPGLFCLLVKCGWWDVFRCCYYSKVWLNVTQKRMYPK